jgi:BirA family transcriptional regulator, biotin operon repressor / biotin---[acetyl-CoA-carboxylase] ligase
VAQPYRKLVLDQAGSTNREAFALAACGAAGPLWIAARRQTAGRGRCGRPWASPSGPGNFYASLLVDLACPPRAVPQLSLLAGVATVDAIRQASGGGPAGLRLKWPNDVLIGQAKCAGILAESMVGQQAVTAVVGIGVNLAWHPGDLGRAATHLAEHGLQVSVETMLSHLDKAMQQWLSVWDGGSDFESVRRAWLDRAGPAGEECTVDTGSERIAGTFVDLDPQGGLVIQDCEGRHRTVTFGDVALAPAAAQEASR